MPKKNALDYHKLLSEQYLSKKKYKKELKSLKKSLNHQYIKTNKWKFRILDIALIFIILFNLGALLMTNFMVVKEKPDKEFKEANQVQCDWNGYTCHSEGNKLMMSFLKQVILWTVIIFLYIYFRGQVFSEEGYYFFVLIVLFYLIGTGTDFTNNMGYYIGKVVYGNVTNVTF